MRKLLFCLILCANAAYIYAQGPAIRSQKFMGEASLGVDIYPALNETDKITKGVGGYPCACMYFRMAYHF